MLTNVELYFVHGWGYDHHVWRDWLPSIRPDVFFTTFDRGYFKNQKQDFSLNISGRQKILISHSFGLHYLPSYIYTQIHLLVLISGFGYFHEHSANERMSRKRIELMRQRVINSPRELLHDFYKKCGLNCESIDNPPVINQQLLHDDLLLLGDNQIDLSALKQIPMILLLHGKDDQIVDMQHSIQLNRRIPSSKLHINENAHHALPLTDSFWCMNIIQSYLNNKIFVHE